MGVIELNGNLRRESLKGCMGAQIFFDNIPDGAGDEKVLLDEPEFLTRLNRIRGIQYLGDRFRGDLLLDSLEIITRMENLHIKFRRGWGCIESQVIHGPPTIAHNRQIMGTPIRIFQSIHIGLYCPSRSSACSMRPQTGMRQASSRRSISQDVPEASQLSGFS